MFTKTSIATLAAVAGFTGLLPAAQAQQYTISRVAPPPPVVEVQPAARPGQVWRAGHHVWQGDRYVWVPGRWIQARNGYDYDQPHWVQRSDGSWFLAGNNWRKGKGGKGDRDHDGIANRNDRDRDGDGVANRYDRFPNNKNRS